MEKTEHEAMVKLFHIAYYIALKGHAFTDFKDMIELEKLHKVNFKPAHMKMRQLVEILSTQSQITCLKQLWLKN